jgi:hypothetical protein
LRADSDDVSGWIMAAAVVSSPGGIHFDEQVRRNNQRRERVP